jgi:FkbM family methyltransferase
MVQRARPWQVGAVLRRVLRYRHAEHAVGGWRLWLDPTSNFGYRMLQDGVIEPDMSRWVSEILAPGDSFIDLGGNEGWFSLLGGRAVGPKGRVLCVEPQERLWPVILRNFALNDLPQCRLVPYACGPEGRGEIAITPAVNSGASGMTPHASGLVKRQTVLVKTLDWIREAHGLDEVKLLKVDIEGYELNALRSGGNALAGGKVRNVLMELHEPELRSMGQSSQEVLDLLAKHGYRLVKERGGIHHFAL